MSDNGPAVVDGKMVYTSASAINRHAACKRSWWFRYVAGLPDDAGPAAELGKQIHREIEHYLKTGEDILSPLAAKARPYFPASRVGLLVEGKVDGVLDAAGIPLKGGMDLYDPVMRVVTDWKTKGNVNAYLNEKLGQYATRGDWLVDIDCDEGRQMLAYAETVRRMFPQGRFVILRHVYIPTKTKSEPAQSVDAEYRTSMVRNAWDFISVDYVEPMKVTAAAKAIEDVEPNRSHCYKYHKPCPYIAQCPDGGAKTVNELFGLDVVMQKENPVMSMLSQMKALNGLNYPPLQNLEEKAAAVAPPTITEENVIAEKQAAPPPVVAPPIAPPHTAEAAVDTAIAMAEDGAQVSYDPLPKPSEGKKRGRPRKDAVSSAPHVRPPSPGIHLYFGCSPNAVATTTLHGYTLTLERQVLESFESKAASIFHSDHKDLKYAAWEPVLAAAANKYPPPPGHYLVTPGDRRVDVVASALEGMLADVPGAVVRGGR